MRRTAYILLCLVVIVAGCQGRPLAEYDTGEVLLRENFDHPIGWDSLARDYVKIGPEAGAYRIHTDVSAYVRGFNSTPHEDVVIETQSSQLSADRNNAYGVVCRAAGGDDSANGYYFLIGGNGSYSIQKGQFGDLRPLVHWARSGAINQGTAVNTIRAVCVGNYLALYVNDRFLTDIYDDTFSRGFAGFAAATGRDTTAEIAFDYITITEATLTGQ
jgi:hypothetical protein